MSLAHSNHNSPHVFLIFSAAAKHSLDNCFPNPCQNGGSCFPTHDGFKCMCMQGYKGKTCEGDHTTNSNFFVLRYCSEMDKWAIYMYHFILRLGRCVLGRCSFTFDVPEDVQSKDNLFFFRLFVTPSRIFFFLKLLSVLAVLYASYLHSKWVASFLVQAVCAAVYVCITFCNVFNLVLQTLKNSFLNKACFCFAVVEYCRAEPCLNGGTCKETTTGYTCLCKSRFRGKNCDSKYK